MSQLKYFIKAARLRTIPLSISGVLAGAGLAGFHNSLSQSTDYILFGLAIICTIGFQVLSNFANDYGDGIKGTDDVRTGEKRMISSGLISPHQMKSALVITILITFLFALLLLYKSFGFEHPTYFILYLCLWAIAITAALMYTIGKYAYGYYGFGDLFVFLFFGWLSTMGTYFLFAKSLNFNLVLIGSAIGLLSVAVLNLNNMRDRITDLNSNKITMVVKLGSQKAKTYHFLLIGISFGCTLHFLYLNQVTLWKYLILAIYIPLVFNLIKVAKNLIHAELDGELKKVAITTFIYAILVAVFFYK